VTRGFLVSLIIPIGENPKTVPGGDINLSRHKEGYEEWVNYLSEQYREIHTLLLEKFDNVVTLADHGELFGEGGAKAHFCGLFKELIHVPLVISGTDIASERRDDVVSLVDVHATVSAMANLQPANRGVDLLTETGSEPRLVEFHGFRANRLDSLRSNGFSNDEISKYDQYCIGIVMPENYYGHESVDGFVEHGTPNSDSLELMATLRDSLDIRDVESTDKTTLSESTNEQLKRLGYLV